MVIIYYDIIIVVNPNKNDLLNTKIFRTEISHEYKYIKKYIYFYFMIYKIIKSSLVY